MDRLIASIALAAVVGAGCAKKVPPETEPVAIEEVGMQIQEHRSGAWSPGLTEEEKTTVFAIAGDTLRWCTSGSREPFALDAYELTPKLREEMATFVTLKVGDRLRGCIGSLAPVAPLAQSIHDNTVNAALRDTRFRPVTAEEVAGIEIHLSVLSPIVPIPSLAEFHIGEHGIILEKGRQRAVFLPQVAVEQNWTKEETLTALSMKAGLPADAWRAGASFKVFSSVALAKEARRNG